MVDTGLTKVNLNLRFLLDKYSILSNMTIQEDIQTMNAGLDWLQKYKPEQYEQVLFTVLEGRRRLRRLARTLAENPAIGAFGESQTGKSYQINTLLNRSDKPFLIRSTSHPEGVGFVDKLNPIGDKREATGVVTRLTSFSSDPGRYNADYPIIVKLLSTGQLATILSSGYFSNIRGYTTYSKDELTAITESLMDRYGNSPVLNCEGLTEDDILDIKSYLQTYHKSATQELMRHNYFETVARIIGRVPIAERADVLKYLWHENEAITYIFIRLTSALQRLDFADEVYVPLEAAIHGGSNANTIMSVACLVGIDSQQWDIKTDVFVPEHGDRTRLRCESGFLSCDLSAISAEVIYRIDDEYLEETRTYCYEDAHENEPGYLSRYSRNKLAGSVSKDFLRDNDLLDFPGARSPEQQDEAFCTRDNRDASGQSVLVKLFLRGKIAYLFNYYSESHMMKVLLFCHHEEQSEVKNLHILLNQWVKQNVGSNVEERAATLARSGGVSPLMIVATKINIDMTFKNHSSHNTPTAVNNRWNARFRTVLLDDVLNWSNVEWFGNWSAPGVSFKDTYLLRSFEHSSCTPTGNQMFRGYNVETSTPETSLEMAPDYYHILKSTFTGNDNVRKLFFDPELAWDVASTLNNDGSLYIIERMSKVAKSALEIRNEHIKRERDDIMSNLREILLKEYDSDNENEKLLKNIITSQNLRWEFDMSCTADSYYFGHLLQALQITEAECLDVVHDLVHGTAINEHLYNYRDYELILKFCNYFEGCTTEEERWKRLMSKYGWRTKEQAQLNLERRGIDVKKLFDPPQKPKTNQDYIAEKVMKLWYDKINSDGLMNTFTSPDGFNSVLMKDLLGLLIDTSKRLNLDRAIAERIRQEVNVANLSQVNESLIADQMASIINGFVNDFGYSMLSDGLKEKARELAEDNMLVVYDYIGRDKASTFSHEELGTMFEHAFENGGAITESFENHYNEWLEYMTIAFIVHLKRSELPAEVNEELGALIEQISFN